MKELINYLKSKMDGYLVVKFGITAFKLYTVNFTLLTKG